MGIVHPERPEARGLCCILTFPPYCGLVCFTALADMTRETERRLLMKTWVLTFVALVAGAGLALGAEEKKPELTIAVIPKGTTHEFWKSIHAGAIKAERELGV